MQVSNRETSNLAKKVTAVIFFLFYLLFLHYEPHANDGKYVESGSLEYLFSLFFWIFNQTLGMIHEAGHGLCYILPDCPQFITAIMGTVFQIGFPLFVALFYKKRENVLGFYIALFFVGFSTTYTAWYISTANEGLFVPASKSFLGIDSHHDFNYILNTLGLLNFSNFISWVVKITAHLLMIYTCFKMFLHTVFDK